MPVLGASDNEVAITVKTRADTGGLDKAEQSFKGMTGAVAVGQAAFEAMRASAQRVSQFISDSSESANRYQAALLGLTTVTNAFGQSQEDSLANAKALAADGLMSITDAAAGLKNLLATGFSLDEATTLMERFKDSAAFGRQGALQFGEAIVGATQGIKNGNSILVDNAGVTKNLSIILSEMGYSTQDVMNITSNASVRQALFNGILKETAVQTGDAAKLANTYAGTQSRAAVQTEMFKVRIGQVKQILDEGLIRSFGNFLDSNGRMIIQLGAAGAAAIGAGAAIYALVAAVKAFNLASIIAAASNPLILTLTAIGALAGTVVFKAMGKLQDQANKTNNEMATGGQIAKDALAGGMNDAAGATSNLAKELANIDDQISKARRDYREQLAGIVKDHQDKVKDLQTQISDENKAYAEANAERTADFKAAQEEASLDHKEKVSEIQRQLDREVALGKWADQRKIADLQNQLNTERAEYEKASAERLQEYETDVAKAKETSDKKVSQLTTQLNEEKAFLEKHASSVKSIRNVQLLDEIDRLKRSHQEQLKSFAEQKKAAVQNAKDTSAGVNKAWADSLPTMEKTYDKIGDGIGTAIGDGLKEALKQSFKDLPGDFVGFFDWATESTGKSIGTWLYDNFESMKTVFGASGRAKGGSVSAGSPYLVGENRDGSINSTTELFVPSTSGQIFDARTTRNILGGMGGGGGVTINQTNYNYSQFDMMAANRELGWQLSTI